MLRIFIIIILLIIPFFAKNLKDISDYKILHNQIIYNNSSYTLIRSFKSENVKYFLAVNNQTLQTRILEDESLLLENLEINSRYEDLLKRDIYKINRLQNDGIGSINSINIFLTMDFCPSAKNGYEKDFINKLVFLQSKRDKPIPITLFISGKWINKHQKEVLELEKLLLSYDLIPSILFRFPGLISDKNSLGIIKELGLITIGSDTWLKRKKKLKMVVSF